MKKRTVMFDIVISSLLFVFILSGITLFSSCAKRWQSSSSLNAEQEFEKFNELFKEGKPFYTLEEATDIAHDLIPEIEKLSGKKFTSMPQIRLIDAATAEDIFKQQNSLIQNNGKVQSRKQFSNNEEKFFQIRSKTVGGIYEPKKKRLNLIPTHIEPMLRLMQLGDRYGMLVVKMTIAHELTHALQDQHIDLDKKIKKAPGAEERYALSAAIEGHANFIKNEVGKQLGIKYSKSEKRTDLQFKNPLIKKITSSNSPYVLKYTKGTQFIEYHFKKGGNRLLWKILENPPVDTSMIIYPETYSPKSYNTFNYKLVLENVYDFSGIDKNTKKIKFKYNNFSLSKFSIMEAFSDLKMPNKNHIISKIGHYQTVLVTHNDITFAKIAFIVLKGEQYTPQYIELEQKYVTQKVDASFADMSPNFFCKKDSIEIAREITTHEKFKTWYEQEKLIKRKYAILAKNNMIVTYSDMVFWLDDCKILKIAEKIFTRYENDKEKEKENIYSKYPLLPLNHN